MARGKWFPLGNQQSTAQAAQDTTKPLPIPSLTSADAKKFGFENFGNTCYANSVLQALYFCAPFRDLLLQSVDQSVVLAPPSPAPAPAPSPPPPLVPVRRKPERKQSTAGTAADAALPPAVAPIPADPPTLLAALRSLFYYISSHPAERGTVAPRAFINKLKEVNTAFDSTMHQDAHEFLNYLLNKIVEDIREEIKEVNDDLSNSLTTTSTNSGKPLQDATIVHRLFEGVLTSETRCLTCETVSSRDESFLDLSIDIEQNSSVTACLRQFSASEMLCQKNKFFCDACCDLQEAEKRMKVKKLPNVLALHLKRFKYQEDVQRYIKLVYRVAFPFELRLFNTVDGIDDADRLYNLFAIVVHIGNGPHHGHYVSIIKTLGSWLLFDDDNVTPVPENDITKYFGDSPSGCAYVLYYQAADIDLPGLGLARDMARELGEKSAHVDSTIEISTQRALEGKAVEEDLALPPGLLVDEKGLNGSNSSLGEPGTPSASSTSASDSGPVTSPLRTSVSAGMGGVPTPSAIATSRSLPSPPTALNGNVPSSVTGTGTSPSMVGKMDLLINTIRKKPSMSIKTGWSAVGLKPGTPSEGRKSGSHSSAEGRRPSTGETRRSMAGERSPASADVRTARPVTAGGTIGTPLPSIPSHSTGTSGHGAQTVPPTPKLLFSDDPASAPTTGSTPSMAVHRPTGDGEGLEDGVSEGGERNERGSGSIEKGTGGEKKERGVKKNWFGKRKSFKIGEKGGRAASENSEGRLPPSPHTRGGEDNPSHASAGPSSAPRGWFGASRRPAESDGSDAPSHSRSSRDLGSSHFGSTLNAPSPTLATFSASTSSAPALQPSSPYEHHLHPRTKPPPQLNGHIYDINHSPSSSLTSAHTTQETGHPNSVPRIQPSLSTPSPVTLATSTNTHHFPNHIDHPPARKSSLQVRPLPQPEGSPGRKKSTPVFPTFRDDVGEKAEGGMRDSAGRPIPARTTSMHGEGKDERPLPPVPSLIHDHRTRTAKGGIQNGFGFGSVESGNRGTARLSVDDENESEAPEDPPPSFSPAPSSSHTPPSSYAPSLSAPSSHNQPNSTFSLGSFGSTNHSNASSTTNGQKRASRKLSLTTSMLGWRKDKEEEREREKGRQKERDKAGPSSFTRF
ncbi:hypothetical protein BDZ94DRAFT_1180796 [Collybia nuda]|uniref:ubiquitinyl hydrolase 1 n=1 Tax=Collybia nuda TaxID=64659 RepID=A0A9P6CPV0_9AGAR|nr:hypothetical protein BDZ94DRAFT_1180796 [Collybia nuda]